MQIFAYDDRKVLPPYIRQVLIYYANYLHLNISLLGRARPQKNGFPLFSDGICMPPGIGHYRSSVDIAACENLLELFGQRFVNYSTNEYQFERACFDRWFVLNAATKELHYNEHICLLDSDFLLALAPEVLYQYCVSQSFHSDLDFISDWKSVPDGKPPFVMPSVTIIRKNLLQNLCDFIFFEYFSLANSHSLIAEYYVHISNGRLGGICDMRALGCWLQSSNCKIFNVSELDCCAMRAANNVNALAQLYDLSNSWHVEIGSGKITLNHGSDSINLLGVHFQGGSKYLLEKLDFSSTACQPSILQDFCIKANLRSRRAGFLVWGWLSNKPIAWLKRISQKTLNIYHRYL